MATRMVTCGWSSWGLVGRRPGRGISCPEGVDAVHRSWHSAGEPSCTLAKVLNELNLMQHTPVIDDKLKFKHSCKGETFNENEYAIMKLKYQLKEKHSTKTRIQLSN